MRSEVPPWERREDTYRDDDVETRYWLYLGEERYPITRRPVARVLSQAGAKVTAVNHTEGRR